MKNKQFIFILLAVLVFAGCKDKDVPTYYVDKDMLRYCWFPEGSYWIYEEANTPGWIDSVYVDFTETGIFLGEANNVNYDQEFYGNRIIVRGKPYGRQTAARPTRIDEIGSNSETTEFFSDASGQLVDYVFFQNFDGGDTLPSYSNVFISKRYDTIRLSGMLYQNAIEVVTNPPSAADHTFSTIWVKDIGTIQRSMTDGTVWNLVRYHINN